MTDKQTNLHFELTPPAIEFLDGNALAIGLLQAMEESMRNGHQVQHALSQALADLGGMRREGFLATISVYVGAALMTTDNLDMDRQVQAMLKPLLEDGGAE